jgi:predicted lipid-binding transport protein (Tim44 family)
MGGLIGSLLFGGGHGFGDPGLFDILLGGGGLFLLYRFLRAKRMTAASAAPAGSMPFEQGPSQSWGEAGFNPAVEPTPVAAEQPAFPPGFDAEDLLKGAKVIYTRLQAAWDKRNLEAIQQFVSPEVLAEIGFQAKADPQPGKTKLLLINPSFPKRARSEARRLCRFYTT